MIAKQVIESCYPQIFKIFKICVFMSMYHTCAWCLRRLKEDAGSPRTEVMNVCEIHYELAVQSMWVLCKIRILNQRANSPDLLFCFV